MNIVGDGFEAVAVPIEYGKTGKMSFFINESGVLRGGDHAGAPATIADNPVPITGDRLFEVFDLYRLNRLSQFKTKHSRIEVELTIKRSLDVFSLSETMLLTWKCNIRDRNAFRSQCINHFFSLVRWNDSVIESLKEDHGT